MHIFEKMQRIFFMKSIFIFLGIFLFSAERHPIHVSICEMAHNADTKALEIIHRIFIDDLEAAIRKDINDPELDILNPGNKIQTDVLIKNYLQKKYKVYLSDKPQQIIYHGHEVESDVFLCYLEIEKVKKLKHIKVENLVLLDVFDDQVNLVHIEYNETVKSMKLTDNNPSDELSFE